MKKDSAKLFRPEIIQMYKDKNPFEKLSNIVYKLLNDLIITCRLHPGQKLNVAQIASDLEISRTPVREAITRLCDEGYIVLNQETTGSNSTYYVFNLSNRELKDLYIVRHIVEETAAYLCAQRSSIIDDKLLLTLAEDFRHAVLLDVSYFRQKQDRFPDTPLDLKALTHIETQTDIGFHRLLIDSCGNPYIKELYEYFDKRLQYLSARTLYYLRFGWDKENSIVLSNQHTAIAHAILNGFPELAREAMGTHIIFCKNACLQSRNLIEKLQDPKVFS